MILAGDIGGTHTRLGLFERGKLVIEKKYLSRQYKNLGDIVREFVGKKKVLKGCFGVPGAVREQRCRATNLPWEIDGERLGKEIGAEVWLLNDLEAHAYGIEMLGPEELVCVQKGSVQKGNRALIAAGTGLGEAGLFWDGTKYHPFASEGGHGDFAAGTPDEAELLFWLQEQYGHVSWERVVSGPGLYALYRFLIETKREVASVMVERAFETNDPPTIISQHGLSRTDSACTRALDWFITLYGREAGNLALKMLSVGGLYVGGGIAAHIIDRLKNGPFVEALVSKGRFRELMESMPVYVLLNDNTALLGAAHVASTMK